MGSLEVALYAMGTEQLRMQLSPYFNARCCILWPV